MKKVALTVGLLAVVFNPNTEAKEKPYVGVDYSSVSFDTSTADVSPAAVRLRVGSEVMKYLGVEVQSSFGVTDDEATVASGTITAELKNITGVYMRGQLPIGNAFSVYGVAGYAWSALRISPKIPGLIDNTATDSDVSAGLGAEIKILGKSYLSVDYMEYSEGLTAVSAGIRIPL